MAALFLLLVATPVTTGATTDADTIVSIGESNTDAQRANVLDLLEAEDADQVVTVSVDETLATMDGMFDLSGVDSAYSSTALTCLPVGSGIDVMTRNIEAVPPELYALVLMTAGMDDVRLAVAAPDDAPALGMTALTGVFRTWDMAPCAGAAHDPERRRLALEQLALIAEIGRPSDTIRQTTLVVLEAQRAVVSGRSAPGELTEIVAEEADAAGLALGEADQEAIVDSLARLSRSDIDWGSFAAGWSTERAEDGSGVALVGENPGRADSDAPARGRTVPSGVGARTGPIEVSGAPTALPGAEAAGSATTPEPTAVPTPATSPLNLPLASTPVPGDDDSGVMGTISDRGGDALVRWWPLAPGGDPGHARLGVTVGEPPGVTPERARPAPPVGHVARLAASGPVPYPAGSATPATVSGCHG
jgi:uncharacterized protein YpuA (DUF1002 family)